MEMENNIMFEETNYNEVMPEVETTEESGMGTGLAMLIGAGVVAAGAAVVKLTKIGIAKWKAYKELRKPAEEEPIEVDDEDIEEITTAK